MKHKQLGWVGTLVASAILLAGMEDVQANDGELSYGGTPRLMNGEGTVSMQSEVILMDIGKEEVKVDCRFVFKNHGPKRTVRMGFPDGDDNSGAMEEGAKLTSAFSSFQSYVDGKLVKTTLVRGKNKNDNVLYHTKNVTFGAQQTRVVRDVYTVPVGGAMANTGGGYFSATYYILHTGSSWRGNIGRSEIIARFRRNPLIKPDQAGRKYQTVQPIAFNALGRDKAYSLKWVRPDREVVVYEGPGRPTVDRNTLRWVRTNWRPTKKDDIFLIFKWKN